MYSEFHENRFIIEYKKGWATLSVFPVKEQVYVDEVVAKMRLLRIPPVRTIRIRKIIEKRSGNPEKLIKWAAGEKLSARIDIEISKNDLLAFITISPPQKGGGHPEIEDLYEIMNKNGIVSGIDEDVIKKTIKKRIYNRKIKIASGEYPVPANPQKMKYYFNVDGGKPYLKMKYGKINLKELDFIHNRKKDELIAEIIPPTTGKPGFTIKGKILSIPPAPKQKIVKSGRNTYTDKTGRRIFSNIDGNVRIAGDSIIVEPVVTVNNINYETGNIRFDGSVIIKDSIASDFSVKAGGIIQIKKCVNKAFLKSGSNIILRSGINGNGRGYIECGGDLYAKYIDSSIIKSDGNVFVEEAVMNSELYIKGNLVLTGKRAEIIGGTAIIGGSLRCKKIGNIYDARTRIFVSMNPDKFIRYSSFLKELNAEKQKLDTIDEKIVHLKAAGPLKTGEDFSLVLEKLKTENLQTEKDIFNLEKKIKKLRKEIQDSTKNMIIIENQAYKGSSIFFGLKEYSIEANGLKQTVFSFRNGKIVESGFNPADPPAIEYKTE